MTAGFGIERLGLVALRFPLLSLLTVVALAVLSGISASHLKFNSDIREIFRSGSADFAALESMTRQYASSEHDLLLVIEGDALFRPGTLERLRNLHLDLRFVDGVEDVLSIFSARRSPIGDPSQSLVVPGRLAEVEDLGALASELQHHPLVRGKLLSADSRVTLMVLALGDERRELAEIGALVGEVRAIAEQAVEGSGLEVGLTGFPAMRVAIIGALKRDQRLFIAVGFGLALLLSWLFLQRLRDVVIVCVPPALSTVGLFGSMWATGQELNILTNGVPALVMVIAFSDSLHLMFAVRRKLEAGLGARTSIAEAVEEVGPACVLTSLTTAIALSTLTWVPNALIAGFGTTAALGTLVAYLATMATLPALAVLFLSGAKEPRAPQWHSPVLLRTTAAANRQVTRAVLARPRSIVATGILLFAVTAALYAANRPHYVYREYLPAESPAYRAMGTIDRALAGTSTLRVHLQWLEDQELLSAATIDLLGEVEAALVAEPLVREVWSIRSVTDWLESDGASREEALGFLEQRQNGLIGRMLSSRHRSVLVTAQFVDSNSSVLVPALDAIEARLSAIEERHPGVAITLTGISALAARMSTQMISRLNLSLLSAIVVIIALLGIALRSPLAMLAAVLPNLLPIAIGGTYLFLASAGLQFTSVIVFTLGFGIAVDSTIHVLHRYRLSARRTDDADDALTRTLHAIGPVVIVSTLVLVVGIGASMMSEMPSMQLYGRLAVLVLAASLAGALVLLPAILHAATLWANGRKHRH